MFEKIFSIQFYLKTYFQILKSRKNKKIFVFGAPYHSNMGDQAQTLCIRQWLERTYPEYTIIILETLMANKCDFKFVNIVKRYIHSQDLVFLHSGYHTTDLYMLEEKLQRKVVQEFRNNKLIAFPQTIYYSNELELEKAKKIYNGHHNLVMLCRDITSYETANDIFPRVKTLLFPDIVTSRIGKRYWGGERKKVLFCMRNDKEGLYSSEEIEQLRKQIEKKEETDITDTTLEIPIRKIRMNREEILNELWTSYAGYKLVITDRYHGTIFSLVAGTPVIVLASTDHKLESGVKWFPESFSSYVKFARSLNEAYEYAEQMLETKYDYKLEDYFDENYYSKLKKLLE
ncbi:hypothetical protein EAI89_11760 [Eubacterium sp. am_0171]|uniref:polysaccharide pyruvyl transferase family protein n=1 Tax=unclassified Eubacterium (in: firmicutes) TaxID=2624479 RepID=UPI00101F5E0A|nr:MULTISPECIES: polysaccharide pyruvyl transferase family protein [unclassified Eubacterium (in: firmicutes)]MSC84782.1 hypothetical protein [Eubacterium sp. BIOML-A1]MSD06847.1 hypothetical protein [Eubacterium sp. BIOML-A2]RYT17616.1 hypothetical protein EAI89_11760 [Eubacterium sp. am_0171]